jgi:hypothetical protein
VATASASAKPRQLRWSGEVFKPLFTIVKLDVEGWKYWCIFSSGTITTPKLNSVDKATPKESHVMSTRLPTMLSLDATEVTLEKELLDGVCTVTCLGAKTQAEVRQHLHKRPHTRQVHI